MTNAEEFKIQHSYQSQSLNRLGLQLWSTDSAHPRLSRVIRLWF